MGVAPFSLLFKRESNLFLCPKNLIIQLTKYNIIEIYIIPKLIDDSCIQSAVSPTTKKTPDMEYKK